MKLKSLLIGSAAAMGFASAAAAADAIVAEPEPMEYVKVCDTYGAGWHYIPGTETCLKFDGYVRTQYDYTSTGDRIGWGGRARFNIDAREETDYGTLRGFIRIQTDFPAQQGLGATGDGNAVIDQAYIQLGGWFFGYADSNWVRNEYGGYNIFDGPYGYHQSQIVAYTYSANGFTGTLSLERNFSQHRYVPNIIGHMSYSGSWGMLFAAGVVDFEGNNTTAYAVKGGVQFNLDALSPGDLLRIQGTYGSAGAPYLSGNGRWEAFAAFQHVFNSEWSLRLLWAHEGQLKNWGAAAQLRWNVVPNLSIRNEVAYASNNGGIASFGLAANQWRWRMRIVRSF